MTILLCLIFMPLIYEGIHMMITYWHKAEGRWKKHIQWYCFILIIDYILEIIYCAKIKSLFGVSIFSKEFLSMETYGFLPGTIIILGCSGFCGWLMLNTRNPEHTPMTHAWINIIVFIAILIFIPMGVRKCQAEATFNAMEYNHTQRVIFLRALGDTHTTTGSISGKTFIGTGYINGQITDNYVIYYAYKTDTGEVIIDHIPYDENTHIYEEGESCEPRLVIHHYYKSYETKHNSYSHEYTVYEIYIPSIMNGIRIDME